MLIKASPYIKLLCWLYILPDCLKISCQKKKKCLWWMKYIMGYAYLKCFSSWIVKNWTLFKLFSPVVGSQTSSTSAPFRMGLRGRRASHLGCWWESTVRLHNAVITCSGTRSFLLCFRKKRKGPSYMECTQKAELRNSFQ